MREEPRLGGRARIIYSETATGSMRDRPPGMLFSRRAAIGTDLRVVRDRRSRRGGAAGGADYVGFGPVFATATKGAALPEPHDLRGLARAVRRAGRPVVAIGGITAATAADVARAGAAAWAVIGGLPTFVEGYPCVL